MGKGFQLYFIVAAKHVPGLIKATAARISVCGNLKSFELQDEMSCQMEVRSTLKQRYFSQQRASQGIICKMARCATVVA